LPVLRVIASLMNRATTLSNTCIPVDIARRFSTSTI
jgi:hypothetical protein